MIIGTVSCATLKKEVEEKLKKEENKTVFHRQQHGDTLNILDYLSKFTKSARSELKANLQEEFNGGDDQTNEDKDAKLVGQGAVVKLKKGETATGKEQT